MKKNNPIVKIAVFGVIAVILWGVGFFTKLWDTIPKGTGIHLNPANILRMLFWIAATIFIERLIVYLLSLQGFLYGVSCHLHIYWQFYLLPSNLDTFYFFFVCV